MKGPLNTCLKDRYTLIEQSQYSSEEQCSKVIGELLLLSACNDLFFWSSTYSLVEVVIQNGNSLQGRI